MADYALYRLKISLLTPLHIGNGRELMHEYDYALYKGATWRLNEAALLEAQNVEDPLLADKLAQTPPAQLLKDTDFDPQNPYFRYVIRGLPRSRAEGAVVREQLKDPFDRLYLPGSSLKGALRTALAWYTWGERKLRPDLARLGRDRRFAAQGYEHDLFGPDSNHDALRALIISDSQPLPVNDRLFLANVRVLNRGGSLGSPIEVEAVRADTTFEAILKLDLALFSEWARRHKLNLSGEEWLRNLAQVVQTHSQERIRREKAWFASIPNGTRLHQFYARLEMSQVPENAFLLQLGWGTGWEDKTFGTRLSNDGQFMERLIQQYKLARGRRKPGDPFPKSRRVIMVYQHDSSGKVTGEQPALPLGWLLVEMEKVK